MEFDSDETIDKFDTSWWKTFHSAVDNSDIGRSTPAGDLINYHDAVAFGQFGLDCAHGCGSELHPVMFLAIRLEKPHILNYNSDSWAIFVRNSGDEGYCSTGLEHVDLPVLSFILPPPDQSVTSVSVTKSEFRTLKESKQGDEVTSPGVKFICHGGQAGAQIWFGVPRWQIGNFADGVLTLSWGHQKSVHPPCGSAPNRSPSPSGVIRQHAPPSVGGEYPETRIEALLAAMTPRQRQIYNRFRPHITNTSATVVPAQAAPLPPEPAARGVTPPVRPAQDPGLAAYNRALIQALLKAYGGRLPPYVRRYIVKGGDTLAGIAARFDLFGWQDIYQANSFRIRDPNLIYPGQVLAIP